MCGTCEVLIKENFKTIRKASLKYTSKFVDMVYATLINLKKL